MALANGQKMDRCGGKKGKYTVGYINPLAKPTRKKQ